MANVWVGDDYYIVNVFNKTEDSLDYYQVDFQRIPEATYEQISQWDIDKANASFPDGLSKDNFLANALPHINAAISVWDAASVSDTGW